MKLFASFLFAVALMFVAPKAASQTTPIGFLNVQGVLHENGAPVNGFWWWDDWYFSAATGGDVVYHDTNMIGAVVSNGVGNLILSIDDWLSPAQELYLELAVSRTGEPGSFTVLGPRQRIVPSLFARNAVRAEEARRLIEPLSPDLLPTTISSLTFTANPIFAASSGAPFTVASSGLVLHLNADKLDGYDSTQFWKLEGNGGTTAGTDFLGTTDDEPLELKVNYQRALRLEPTAETPNFIAGSSANSTAAAVVGAAIGGGGSSGQPNTVNASYSTIAGGAQNTISAWGGTISGGFQNTIQQDAFEAAIGGGYTNRIKPNSWFGVIGGGTHNLIDDTVRLATIGGGGTNIIRTGSAHGVIGGGSGNVITNKPYGTIPGGKEGQARDYGQMAYASGMFNAPGDAQSSLFVLRGQSSGAPAELFLDGTGQRMHVPDPGAWMFDILVVGRNAAGATAGYHIVGLLSHAGGLMMFPSPLITDTFGAAGLAATVNVIPNGADGTLRIMAQWSDTTSTWVAKVRTAEIAY